MMPAKQIYNEVINDVIEGVRDDFAEEVSDPQILEDLKNLWHSKLFGNTSTEESSATGVAPSPNEQAGNYYTFYNIVNIAELGVCHTSANWQPFYLCS